MKDLFNPTIAETSDTNGRLSIRRSAFNKKISRTKRNIGFEEIISENGGLPSKNECLLIKSNGTSDTGGLLHCMLQTGICNELYIATWIISRDNIDYICEQIDAGNIQNLVFVISTRQKQLKKSNYAHMVEQFSKRPQAKYRVVNCHAKTFSAKIDDNYYTATGSGNWTKNPRIENYIITNDFCIFDFNKEWMNELV